MPKTDSKHACEKADALKKKLKLKIAIAAAVESIDKIIGDLASEHRIPFEHASTMVYLSGQVFKD